MWKTCLFNDIGTEFLHRKCTYVAEELANNSIAEAVVIQIKDILHHIVAIRILHQSKRIVCYFIYKLDPLMVRGVVDASLENTTSMSMCSNFNAICRNCVVNKLKTISLDYTSIFCCKYLIIFGSEFVKTFLNDVVPI